MQLFSFVEALSLTYNVRRFRKDVGVRRFGFAGVKRILPGKMRGLLAQAPSVCTTRTF
jgi:hypothetical protein